MTAQQEGHLSKVITPPTELNPEEEQHKRLWIGNLDPRISDCVLQALIFIPLYLYWFFLLKLLQKHGKIEKFDLLLHRSGPQAGQPRGYAFCTYAEASDATIARNKLDGLTMGSKRIAVCWAHTMSKAEMEGSKPELNIPVLAGAKPEKSLKRPISRQTTIQAIEAKLKLMEHKNQTDQFEIDNSPAAFKAKPHALVIAQSHSEQQNKPMHSRHTYRNHDRKPYKYKPR